VRVLAVFHRKEGLSDYLAHGSTALASSENGCDAFVDPDRPIRSMPSNSGQGRVQHSRVSIFTQHRSNSLNYRRCSRAFCCRCR